MKIVIFSLLIVGLIILFSASLDISQKNTGKPYYYFLHQLLSVVIGVIVFFIFSKINYKVWKKIALLIFFASLILLVLVFIPGLGTGHAGAQRWIQLGSISFQPSEFLKLAFIIYLAAFFSKKENQKINTLIPFLLIMGAVGILMALQSDAGTLGLIAVVGFIIYFLSGAKLYQWLSVLVLYTASFFALIRLFPHRMARFAAFFNPNIDTQGISYQINQALLAIGSGGLFGVGLAKSQQRYSYLPEPMGDSIFAIAAEEVGFVGILVLITLFIVFAFKGLKIGKNAKTGFGRLLALGIVSWLIFQTFINIMGISGLIPLTGIPLPFVSYGGSAIIITLAAAGILVNISKQT